MLRGQQRRRPDWGQERIVFNDTKLIAAIFQTSDSAGNLGDPYHRFSNIGRVRRYQIRFKPVQPVRAPNKNTPCCNRYILELVLRESPNARRPILQTEARDHSAGVSAHAALPPAI